MWNYWAATVMLIPRLLRAGARMVKELSKDGYTCVFQTGCMHQRWQPVFSLQSKTKVFQGSIFQKYLHFSTTANNDSRDEGSEQKDIVTFVDKDGEEKNIKVPVGMSMLEAAHENDIELEGACEGSLACSTCHVIVVDVEQYNKLEDPTDEENDMLDLAFGLTETSRLGCQIIARSELDGIRLAIPAATRNLAVDGYVPKPHWIYYNKISVKLGCNHPILVHGQLLYLVIDF
ncbi:adrenodoxin-like protein 1, mitochondrial isoform X2 [Mangifera indica]|uniref:adrenodoxin-like protein 1, mitochondrial isoform X2 n=1 Tax=Mangifera indica TaxID=29780 RepID=UPI001CFAC550|nr:adrenodoxin-like protein 1, mitochondrial isoform X2 [Mangifera indica]